MDFIDDIPEDYVPKQKMTEEEANDIIEYFKNHPLSMKEIPENIEGNEALQAL